MWNLARLRQANAEDGAKLNYISNYILYYNSLIYNQEKGSGYGS
jgi:hypothetical protein